MAFVTNEIMKEKRDAIKALFPTKKRWKFSVRKQNHSTIVIDLMEYPEPYYFDGQLPIKDHGEQEKEILEAVKTIAYEGHWDKSDIMTDYFHCAWYVSINIGKWDKPVKRIAI